MIKIKLEKWEKSVVMQILEMDESLRGKGVIFNNDNMHIFSKGIIELDSFAVFIRGNYNNYDYNVTCKMFKNNSERDEYYNRVIKLFQDYNNRDKDAKSEENIFILE